MAFLVENKIYVGISLKIMYNRNVYVCLQKKDCYVLTSNVCVKGYNLAYFSFFLTYGGDTKNGRGEANIINLIPYENFDGFIVCHDTFHMLCWKN